MGSFGVNPIGSSRIIQASLGYPRAPAFCLAASGGELIELTRAFMYAGARHVVATLWRIDDEATAILMERFYELMETMPVAAALRLAQISVRNRYPHLFHWAAFNIFGQYQPVKL